MCVYLETFMSYSAKQRDSEAERCGGTKYTEVWNLIIYF